jgi:phage shock protein PspC (stress-responsive transcriptional regulator)
MTTYRLTRNMLDRVLGGVSGGIGTYLGISSWWIRLGFIALTLTSFGFGVLSYILLWMLLPGQTLDEVPPFLPAGQAAEPRYARPETMLGLGALAILVGGIVLAQGTGILQGPQGDLLAPVMLFLVGLTLLLKHFRGRA